MTSRREMLENVEISRLEHGRVDVVVPKRKKTYATHGQFDG